MGWLKPTDSQDDLRKRVRDLCSTIDTDDDEFQMLQDRASVMLFVLQKGLEIPPVPVVPKRVEMAIPAVDQIAQTVYEKEKRTKLAVAAAKEK